MSYTVPGDVAAAIELLLQSGNYATAEDVLRDAMQALNETQDDWAAIKAALDERDAGAHGISVDEAFRIIREQHG